MKYRFPILFHRYVLYGLLQSAAFFLKHHHSRIFLA